MSVSALKEQIRSLSMKGLEVVEDPKLTPAEKATNLENINVDLHAKQDELKNLEVVEENRKAFLANTAGSETNNDGGPVKVEVVNHGEGIKSLGSQFVESAGYKAAQDRNFAGSVQFATDVKTTLTEGSGSGGPAIRQDWQPGIVPILFRRLTVADLMPSGTTNSNVVRYVKETTATNAASSVAEGGTKPESTLVFAQVDEPVQKIATVFTVSDEMLMDYSQIRSYLDARGTLFVKLQEESELLTGNGTAPDLTGILNRSGLTAAQAVGGDTAVDAIYKDITKIRVASFLEPDAIVLHPNNWQTIRLSKDANNQYFGGGPFNYGPYGVGGFAPDGQTNMINSGGESLWGLRVVVTPAMTSGTALIGSFGAGAQVFRNGGLTIDATNSHASNFTANLTTIRIEERLALAVYRPGAFSTVTGIA